MTTTTSAIDGTWYYKHLRIDLKFFSAHKDGWVQE